jgi:molybdenum cofactor cytidylyltransferase
MHQATARNTNGLWTILLAAGEARRFGAPKQLARFGGHSLLVGRVRLAEEVTPGRVLIVLGAHGQRLRSHLRRNEIHARIAYNAAWPQGLSASLRDGVSRLPRSARAALVLLCDQPAVDAHGLARLIHGWLSRPQRIAASLYGGRIGVPAIFPRAYFRKLEGLRGDSGARDLLRAADITGVALPEAELDVDEPRDLLRLSAR